AERPAQREGSLTAVPGVREARARSQVVLAHRYQVMRDTQLVRDNPLYSDGRIAVDDRLRRVSALHQAGNRHVVHDTVTREVEQRCDALLIEIGPQILPAGAGIHRQTRSD